jgi:hypothetical protein
MSSRSRRALLVTSALATAALLALPWATSSSITGHQDTGASTLAAGPHHGLPRPFEAVGPAMTDDADTHEQADQPAYLDDQLLVGIILSEDLAVVAADHGLQVAREIGPSGYGALLVDDPSQSAELIEALAADPRVRHVGPMGAIYGAGKGDKGKTRTTTTSDAPADTTSSRSETTSDSTTTTEDAPASIALDLTGYQWHLDDLAVPSYVPVGQGKIVVAVLDTGVAYTAGKDFLGRTTVAAASLSGSAIVAPWDFVNDDALPLDDNQHGTHMASLIASDGAVKGVAPGAALMPIKVLDWYKAGSELNLLDGLAHATANGADVISLSLAFSMDYAPSGPLQAALADAADAGIVIVGATGNASEDGIAWPAASPAVISVAASNSMGNDLAWYANTSPGVDLLAPGGDLGVDVEGDGQPDGILGETIAYMDARSVGYYFGEGTSQAAALTSGAAARLLAEGVAPADVPMGLKRYAQEIGWVGDGTGGGIVDVANAEKNVSSIAGLAATEAVHVSMLPYLTKRSDGTVEPTVALAALDDAGDLLSGVDLWVKFEGSASGRDVCRTKGGVCSVSGPAVAEFGAAFAVVVEGASDRYGVPLGAPTAAFFASDALEVLIAAIDDHPDAAGSMPALYFPAGTDAELGLLPEHYVAINNGTGLLSSPMGFMFTPSALPTSTTLSTATLDLDGTGLLSSPMGFQKAYLLTFTGTGLLSSPMGFKLVTINGTGLLSSPMGFTASSMYVPSSYPTVKVYSPAFSGDAVLLATSTIDSPYASGTWLEATLDGGGWVSSEGGPAASQVLASGSWSWSMPKTSSLRRRPVELVP